MSCRGRTTPRQFASPHEVLCSWRESEKDPGRDHWWIQGGGVAGGFFFWGGATCLGQRPTLSGSKLGGGGYICFVVWVGANDLGVGPHPLDPLWNKSQCKLASSEGQGSSRDAR